MKILFLALMVSSPAYAFEVRGTAKNYDEAKKATSYLHFEYPVRKLVFSATEDGYADKFEATAKIEEKHFSGARVAFDAHELDTDNYQRNDNLWKNCLDFQQHPKITVTVPATDFTEGKSVSVNGTMNIRGKDKPIPMEITLSRKNGKWVADGKGHGSFTSLEIPDPSIGVAAVRGPIEITFHLEEP